MVTIITCLSRYVSRKCHNFVILMYCILFQVIGKSYLQSDGYLMDFGIIKKAVRSLCKSMNEYFICPMKSDVLTIKEEGTQLCLECEDGAIFSFPRTDCLLLPLIHSSAEELAHYMYFALIR